ncbi:UNVERIFIED_CONTAM: hypothetical protein GTU68_002508 [Idotea baltica]|nr:hypothetical protein [Idotea baltica]
MMLCRRCFREEAEHIGFVKVYIIFEKLNKDKDYIDILLNQ